MFKTKNNLMESKREQLAALLNARLADTLDLASQAKQAHWNVKGPSFIALHKLFDDVVEDLREYADEIAERAVQLGGVAMGTARLAAERSSLPEYPHDISSGRDHVEALSTALGRYGASVRAAIERAEELGDAGTADLFTQVSRGVDKWLWFVEAHAQSDR